MIKKILAVFLALLLCACAPGAPAAQEDNAPKEQTQGGNPPAQVSQLKITVGDKIFAAALEDDSAARELAARLPLTADMRELNGNEKYYRLDGGLTENALAVGSVAAGDLMLYGADCLVLFYEGAETPYSYTRLGKIGDAAGLAEALGKGNVTVRFEADGQAAAYDGVYPQHEPYGAGIGAMPGRVVWAHDPGAVDWDGEGWWWAPGNFDEAAVLDMVNESVASLGGKETAQEGWRALFAARNGGEGYAPGEKLAIKANINGSAVNGDDTSGETRMSYTNPVLLKALLTSLVTQAGVAPADITVYDVSRLFPDYMVEMCGEGALDGVRFADRNSGAADESAPIEWSYAFGGSVNYLPACVTEAAYVINLANLKGHSYGITLCGKNHFGSFINGNAMRPPEGANLHQWLTKSEMGIYSPLTDLMANEQLGGKTVLYMLDALICAPSEGASITGENALWRQTPFNGGYTASVFLSQDPVAIDSVGADFLMNEPAVTENNGALRGNASVENYLHEAALAADAPSGTVYYNGAGERAGNLGVHEHWNNSADKQYSRNLGKSEGIELIYIGVIGVDGRDCRGKTQYKRKRAIKKRP